MLKRMEFQPILRESFYHEGRGPELQKIHYVENKVLKAIDYFNPDDEFTSENLKHLYFIKAQVFMFTPHEVYNYGLGIKWSDYNFAAILCLGKSRWLETFAPTHLEKCLHYQIMFYDDFLDVICEGIEAKPKGFIG